MCSQHFHTFHKPKTTFYTQITAPVISNTHLAMNFCKRAEKKLGYEFAPILTIS
jgi:hypothetical protein